jgi:two-component sensor histidine kinase
VSPAPRAPTVRRRLLVMALSLMAPAAVFMGLLVLQEYREGRQRYERQLVATTRALSVATDRQLAQSASLLMGLAVSEDLLAGDLPRFETQARAASRNGPGWIVLADASGRQLINTRAAPGAMLPRGGFPAQTWTLLRSGRTVVSNLAFGAVARRPIVAIDMPVIIGGQLHALSYVQEPAALGSIFRAQGIPPSWTASIVDRRARLVARSRDEAAMVGRHASPDMRKAMARSSEGVILTHTLDGTKTLSAFSTSPNYGWTFIVGVPRRDLELALLRSVGATAVLSGVLFALGAAVAVRYSRRISRDIRGLRAEAVALGAGAEAEPTAHELAETLEVRQALQAAAAALRERDAERARASHRQQLMIHELNHRVKNTLATVQSLAWHSLGRSQAEPRAKVFTERLLALSKAHDLLSERVWENAELAQVVSRTLEPHGSRAQAKGPAVLLSPKAAVTISMLLHELATNAAKYGALSVPEGRLDVAWALAAGELRLDWREQGGPPVAPPQQAGFGSRLIRTTVERDLLGRIALDYRPEGLAVSAAFPLSDEIRLAA